MLGSVSSTRRAASADRTSMTSDSGGSRPARISPLRRWGIVACGVATVLILDQWSKAWALRELGNGRAIDLVPTLSFRLTFNTGMAFSKGSAAGPVIGLVAIVIAAVLIFVARRVTSMLQLVLIGVVIGGALGNVIDRLSRVGEYSGSGVVPGTGFMSGAVVDFIDVSWYAVFNVADAAIVVGGLALVLTGLRTTTTTTTDTTDTTTTTDSAE